MITLQSKYLATAQIKRYHFFNNELLVLIAPKLHKLSREEEQFAVNELIIVYLKNEKISLPKNHHWRSKSGFLNKIANLSLSASHNASHVTIAISLNQEKIPGVDIETVIEPEEVHNIREIVYTANTQLDVKNISFAQNVTLNFSAKEAVYKSCFPVKETFLDFKDISLSHCTSNNHFIATITQFPTLHIQGNYTLIGNQVLTTSILTEKR